MRQFSVDEDLVALVAKRANVRHFDKLSFSDALRMALGAPNPQEQQRTGAKNASVPSAEDLLAELGAFETTRSRKRAPKADLVELVRVGKLHKGQELFLVDYQHNRLGQYKAVVSGGNLLYKAQAHSMSALARDLLKKEGFSSDSVRGPEHWATSGGSRVFDLWEEVLAERSK